MAAANYDACLKRLLVHEGGYTNDAADPGGPTNFGITIIDARKYWKSGATKDDVKAMPLTVATAIYRSKYWGAMRCDDLPSGLDDCVFDYGVNSGNARAIKVLQRLVGVTAGGQIGDDTLAAVAQREPKTLINAIQDERLKFLMGLKTWPVFGRGWNTRVAEVRAYALALASSAPLPAPTRLVSAKGQVTPISKPAALVSTAGASAGTVAVAAPDWAVLHPTLTGIIVIAVLGAVAFALVMLDQRRQTAPTPGISVVPATA